MDEELFRKLHEEGIITAEMPEYWLPTQTKDHQWKNYYIGQDGTPMHINLTGGWMINEDTFKLAQIDSNELEHTPDNLAAFGEDVLRANYADVADDEPIKSNDFNEGDIITHQVYGKGTVMEINGDITVIYFKGMGSKKFSIPHTPIEKYKDMSE